MELPWRVRILSSDGRVCGAGVLINSWRIVTCAHVIEHALGRQKDDRAPVALVDVDFPASSGLACGKAAVVSDLWHPVRPDGRGDLAVLRLESQMTQLAGAPLARLRPPWGREVRIFGYPGRIDDGVWAEARLLGPGGPGGEWIQLDGVRTTGRRVEQGYSGAGVVDARTGAVLGIVVAEDKLAEAKTAWMLPVEVIVGYWSEHLQFAADLAAANALGPEDSNSVNDSRPFALANIAGVAGRLAEAGADATSTAVRRAVPPLMLTRTTSRDGTQSDVYVANDPQTAHDLLERLLPRPEVPDA